MSGKAEQMVGDIAARIFSVEVTSQPPERPNSVFERRFTNPHNNPFLGWNPGPHAIRGYFISDAVLDGGFRALWNADGLIRGTNYLCPDDELAQLAFDQADPLRSSDDSNVIIGCNHLYNNYFHWITQALPAIDFSLRRDGQVRKVALGLPPLKPWQEESLQLLGYDALKRIVLDDRSRFYAFKNIEFTELVNGGASFCLSETAYQTYTRLRQTVQRTFGEGRRIYVARTDSLRRSMRNEATLLDEMQRRGYQIVVPGALGLAEQIQLFRDASLVVGAHGAGMTNIAFCEPGTIIYELVPSHGCNVSFSNLGLTCRLRHWADSFDSDSDSDGRPSTRDWDIDMALVTARLDEIEAISAELQQDAGRQSIGAMDFLRGSPGQLIGGPSGTEPAALPPTSSLLWRLLGRRTG